MKGPAATVRKRSSRTFFGVPLWEIAAGPDEARGEARGHATAIVAVGDVATGVLAVGGVARGFFAVGGVAWGLVAFGGVGLGLVALGGLAIGGLAFGGAAVGGVAVGGGAVGYVAIGGGAVGVYAMGGGAAGEHVIDAVRKDPQAVQFFKTWLPWLAGVLIAWHKTPAVEQPDRAQGKS